MATTTVSEKQKGGAAESYSHVIKSLDNYLSDQHSESLDNTITIALHDTYVKLKAWALDIELEKTSVLEHVDLHDKSISRIASYDLLELDKAIHEVIESRDLRSNLLEKLALEALEYRLDMIDDLAELLMAYWENKSGRETQLPLGQEAAAVLTERSTSHARSSYRYNNTEQDPDTADSAYTEDQNRPVGLSGVFDRRRSSPNQRDTSARPATPLSTKLPSPSDSVPSSTPDLNTWESAGSLDDRRTSVQFRPQRLDVGRRRSKSQETLHEDQDDGRSIHYDFDNQPAADGILPIQSYIPTDMSLDIFPDTIECMIHLTFEHRSEQISEHFRSHLPSWYKVGIYDEFNTWMDKQFEQMRNKFKEPCDKTYKAYSKQSAFRLTYSVHEDGTAVQNSSSWVAIDRHTMRDEVIMKVCAFIGSHPYKHEHANLDIYWDYSTILVEPPIDISFREMLAMEVKRKMKKNFNKQLFIPCSDLAQFLLPDLIQKSLDSDIAFQGWLQDKSPEQQRRLINYIKVDAPRLHLICVSRGLSFSILQHWLDGGLTDLNHSKTSLDDHECQVPKRCSECFQAYEEEKSKFFAWKWPPQEEARNFIEHDENIVLPILYDESLDRIGEGASGQVFRAYIEPDHHQFKGERHCRFALQKFRRRKTVEMAFTNTRKVLEQLSKQKNNYVVAHLSCWSQQTESQDTDYFILYPLAKTNLVDLMERPQPEHSRLNVFWFLRCIKGLTDALKFIHSFSFTPHINDINVDDTGRGFYTIHRNLKPENILCFDSGSRSEGCVLKITGFQTSVIEFLGSGDDFVGTMTYQCPERRLSRPSDLWSLGCILLEFTLWFATPNFSRENFAENRLKANPTEEDGRVMSDLFWYRKEGQKDGQLCKAVQEQLDVLEELPFPFPDLSTVIMMLLEVDPWKRTRAPELDFQIGQILASHGPPHEPLPFPRIWDINARGLPTPPLTPKLRPHG